MVSKKYAKRQKDAQLTYKPYKQLMDLKLDEHSHYFHAIPCISHLCCKNCSDEYAGLSSHHE
jgi:hypothetical protein